MLITDPEVQNVVIILEPKSMADQTFSSLVSAHDITKHFWLWLTVLCNNKPPHTAVMTKVQIL